MNSKTASHYNLLLNNARPVSHDKAGLISGPASEKLWTKIAIIEKSYTDAAVVKIISDAASQNCEANVTMPDWGKPCWAGSHDYSAVPWAATAVRWEMARAEIDAAIAAHNAETLRLFSLYRAACAQGVAVPPSE